jgi:hypothetical protein
LSRRNLNIFLVIQPKIYQQNAIDELSGDPKPPEDNLEITKRLVESGKKSG